MKKFLSKVKSLAKRSKVAVVAAVAAVSSAVVSVCASAATTEASGTDMKSMLAEAGNQLQKSFSDLVMTLIPGRIGTETTARLDRLNESHPDLAPTVTWSANGNIQIGRTFSVTVSTDYDFSFFVFNTAPITISATAEGTSEVFWK